MVGTALLLKPSSKRWRSLPPVAAVLFFRPAESLVGGTDASTRLISGITVSTTGSFVINPARSLGTLEAGSPRPDIAPAAEVKVSLDGHLLDTVRIEGDFAPYHITVPAEVGIIPEDGKAVLRLETTPWVPADYGQADGRELGIKLDWIRIEPR